MAGRDSNPSKRRRSNQQSMRVQENPKATLLDILPHKPFAFETWPKYVRPHVTKGLVARRQGCASARPCTKVRERQPPTIITSAATTITHVTRTLHNNRCWCSRHRRHLTSGRDASRGSVNRKTIITLAPRRQWKRKGKGCRHQAHPYLRASSTGTIEPEPESM